MDRFVSGGAAVQLEVTPKALTPAAHGVHPSPPEEEDRDDTEE
jgi:hypothetical protein